MKHAVIVCHPRPGSYTHAVADAYASAVSALGANVVTRDLYALGFDPRLPASELPGAPDYAVAPDAAAERALLSDAGVFVLVYPFWFNAPPAMLKGYIDRVLGFGFGYRPGPTGVEPALFGRKLLSLTSSGAPDFWLAKTGAVAALREYFDDHVAGVCGLTVVDHLHIGGIEPNITPEAVHEALQSVSAAAWRWFG